MNISGFFDTYKDKGYAVSILPQPMAWEVTVPHCLLCGSRRTLVDRDDPARRTPHPFPPLPADSAVDDKGKGKGKDLERGRGEAGAGTGDAGGEGRSPMAGTRPYITHLYEANLWISFAHTRSQ